jgi:hypothetical protein
MRETVVLLVPVDLATEPRHVKAKLTSSKLLLQVFDEEIINDSFVDERWLSVGDSYWELETKSENGSRQKFLRYLLYLRSDCPKYITGALFAKERENADTHESDDDTVDTRIRTIANVKEPEPRRDQDIYFSDDDEFSDPECLGCGSRSVSVMKKAEDREFKVYCNDCPFVSKADMHKEARSLRRQREVDEARARKKEEKAAKARAARLALQDQTPVDVRVLDAVD